MKCRECGSRMLVQFDDHDTYPHRRRAVGQMTDAELDNLENLAALIRWLPWEHKVVKYGEGNASCVVTQYHGNVLAAYVLPGDAKLICAMAQHIRELIAIARESREYKEDALKYHMLCAK